MYRESTALTIRFPDPGLFLFDTRLEVDLDGTRIYEGSFMAGFERTVQVSPGTHTIVTRAAIGPVLRPRTYTFTLGDAPSYTAVLRYGRFWGNFTGKLKLLPE